MKYKDVVIGFAPNLAPLIKEGKKTLTYRYGDKYKFLEIGDQVQFKDSSNDKVFAEVKITRKAVVVFKDLPLNTDGHEVYKSKKQQRETFRKYYHREIKDDDEMLILGFEVIELIE